MVVVVSPDAQDLAGMTQQREQSLIQVIVAPATIKALDIPVLPRLAPRDVVLLNPPVLRPAQDRQTGQFGHMITDDHQLLAANRDNRIELARNLLRFVVVLLLEGLSLRLAEIQGNM
jgi:hypothetical protein